MLSDRESPHLDFTGEPIESDPRCQWCDRSIVTRFGGEASPDCPSCTDDWLREYTACDGVFEEATDDEV